jgi:hypothetical protein
MNSAESAQTFHLEGWSHLSEYTTLGCRCPDCRAAWKVYSKDYRQRLRAKILAQTSNSANGGTQ